MSIPKSSCHDEDFRSDREYIYADIMIYRVAHGLAGQLPLMKRMPHTEALADVGLIKMPGARAQSTMYMTFSAAATRDFTRAGASLTRRREGWPFWHGRDYRYRHGGFFHRHCSAFSGYY